MTADRAIWNPEMERLEGEELRDLQWAKLTRQIRKCFNTSSFYKKKFAEIGAEPGDIKNWDDFRNLPCLMDKEQQRESQEESTRLHGHPFGMYSTVPVEKILGAYATSGTTGAPTFYLFSEHDFKIHSEIVARIFWRAGVRPGDRILWGFGTGMWIAGAIPPCFRDMGVLSINVGTEGGSEALLKSVLLTRPNILVATPTMLDYLIDRTPVVTGKPPSELGLQRLIAGGEPGAGLVETRRKLEAAFNARLYDFIGPTSQFGYVSCDCKEYQGMHNVAPDLGLWAEDLVDPLTKRPVEISDGAIGEAYMTDLDREAGPVLKYAYGDLVQIFTKPCQCGLPGNRIKILGRSDDMLIIKGVNVYPAAIKSVIDDYSEKITGVPRIVLKQKPPGVEPPLCIEIEPKPELMEAELLKLNQDIEHALHVRLRFRAKITFVGAGEIGRGSIKTKLLDHRY